MHLPSPPASQICLMGTGNDSTSIHKGNEEHTIWTHETLGAPLQESIVLDHCIISTMHVSFEAAGTYIAALHKKGVNVKGKARAV